MRVVLEGSEYRGACSCRRDPVPASYSTPLRGGWSLSLGLPYWLPLTGAWEHGALACCNRDGMAVSPILSNKAYSRRWPAHFLKPKPRGGPRATFTPSTMLPTS